MPIDNMKQPKLHRRSNAVSDLKARAWTSLPAPPIMGYE